MSILLPWIATFLVVLAISFVGTYLQRKEKEKRAARQKTHNAISSLDRTFLMGFFKSTTSTTERQPRGLIGNIGSYRPGVQEKEDQGKQTQDAVFH